MSFSTARDARDRSTRLSETPILCLSVPMRNHTTSGREVPAQLREESRAADACCDPFPAASTPDRQKAAAWTGGDARRDERPQLDRSSRCCLA